MLKQQKKILFLFVYNLAKRFTDFSAIFGCKKVKINLSAVWVFNLISQLK